MIGNSEACADCETIPRKECGSVLSMASDTLRRLVREGGLRAVKIWCCKLFLSGSGMHPLKSLLALRAEVFWADGNHEEVRKIARRLISCGLPATGYHYLAQSAYVHGDLPAASNWLRQLLELRPGDGPATHLLAACARDSGQHAEAWNLLEQLALKCPRAKNWQQLANLVEDAEDFHRLAELHSKAVTNGIIPRFRREILNHLAAGAMRAGDFEQAKTIWRGILLRALASPRLFRNARPKVDVYSRGIAERALVDLGRVMRDAGIEMFLVSGTLLGCVREGRLLSHDKDIDVGLWDHIPEEQVRSAVRKSGLFFFLPSRVPDVIRVRHLNGIPLDLFYHHREGGICWHAGSKNRWENSLFTLETRNFLGETFLIPSNHERYLEENYGDWNTPRTVFDSTFDTPNGTITRPDAAVVHSFRKLFASVSASSGTGIGYYLEKLAGLGEDPFVRTFREQYRGRCSIKG